MSTTQCKSCGAEVFFALHVTSRKLMIFDEQPDPSGRWIMEGGYMKYSKDGDDHTRFMPHHATCPSWTKKNR